MSFVLLMTVLLHSDGGSSAPVEPPRDDSEVVKNLELLELLEETTEFEVLEELSEAL